MIIALEGSDQAGKKTQTVMLSKALKAQKSKQQFLIFLIIQLSLAKKSITTFMAKENFLPKLFIIFMQQTDGKN